MSMKPGESGNVLLQNILSLGHFYFIWYVFFLHVLFWHGGSIVLDIYDPATWLCRYFILGPPDSLKEEVSVSVCAYLLYMV
jgi:hypothetical protein